MSKIKAGAIIVVLLSVQAAIQWVLISHIINGLGIGGV